MYFDLQKASMLKRFSAWLLDIIVLSILATGFGTLVSAVIGYDSKLTGLNERYAYYESTYGIKLDMTEEGFAALSEEELAVYAEADAAMAEDTELINNYSLVINMTLVILSIGILLAYAVSEFSIPLWLKDGQTLGKKVFGLGVMQRNQTALKPSVLAVRTFLGKFTFETMVPVLIVVMIFFGFLGFSGTVTLGILLLLQLAALIYSKTNSAVHDLIAQTVVVDLKSQMIFADVKTKEEFKQKIEDNKDEKRRL